MFCVFTEVLWHKMIHLLLNKTMPHFQLLPVSKEISPYKAFMRCHLYSDQIDL